MFPIHTDKRVICITPGVDDTDPSYLLIISDRTSGETHSIPLTFGEVGDLRFWAERMIEGAPATTEPKDRLVPVAIIGPDGRDTGRTEWRHFSDAS